MENINSIQQVISSSSAVPFVIFDSAKKKFLISNEAKAIIGNSDYSKVGLISLVGKYRTGKSFLLNRVLINRKSTKGFDVGPTIRPCTKGIWLWSDPLLLKNTHSEEPFPAFLIDTEGLGAYDEEVNHDSKIFLIAILISSLFIFNSFGTIDETALNSLSLILHLSKTIKLRNSSIQGNVNEEEEIAQYFPSFLWLLRDFALKLEDSEGNVITAKQYLENALQFQKGSTDKIEEKNQVRKLIKTYFPERDCFLMVRPVEKENELQQLESLPDSSIRTEFLEQAEVLRNKVLKKTKPKIFNGRVMSGGMLLELVESIISSINEGTIPVIENTWKYVISTECIRIINATVEEYRKKMKQFQQENFSHVNIFTEMDKYSIQIIKELMISFEEKNSSFEEGKDFTEKCRLRLIEEKKKIAEENSKLIEEKFTTELDKEITALLNDTKKLTNQSHLIFLQDLNEAKEKLDALIPEFPLKRQIVFDKTMNAIKKYIDLYWVKAKQDDDKTIAQLTFDMNNLNKKISELNVEYLTEKTEQKQTIDKLNDTMIENKLKEKSLEEKIKNYENDKKTMKESSERALQNINKEFETKLDNLTLEKNKLNSELKSKEEELLIAKLNFDKVNALKEQKCSFQEKEIQTWKERFNALNVDLSESKGEYNDLILQNEALKDEVINLQAQLSRQESNALMSSSQGFTSMKGGNMTGNINNNALNIFMKEQTEETKRIKELLNKILTTSSSLINNNRELTASNQTLTLSLASYEDSHRYNEEINMNSTENSYSHLIKKCSEFKCKVCLKFFNITDLMQHACQSQAIKLKEEKNRPFSAVKSSSCSLSNLNANKINTKVTNGILSKDENGKNYLEYIVDIDFNGKSWKVVKRFNQFSILNKAIKNLFKGSVALPDSGSLFVNINDMTGSHDNKIQQLDKYLKELSCIECVVQSNPFKNFLDIEENGIGTPKQSNENIPAGNTTCSTKSFSFASNEEITEDTLKKNPSGKLSGHVKKITVEKKTYPIKSTSPIPSKKTSHMSIQNTVGNAIPAPSNNNTKKINMLKTQSILKTQGNSNN